MKKIFLIGALILFSNSSFGETFITNQVFEFARVDVNRGYVFPISEKNIEVEDINKLVESAGQARSSLDLLKRYDQAFPEIRYVVSSCEKIKRDWDDFVDPSLDKNELEKILARHRSRTSRGVFYSAGTPFSRRELGEPEPTSGFPYPVIILDCDATLKTTLIHETLHYLFDKSLRKSILNKDVFEELGRFAANNAYSEKMTQEKLGIKLSWMNEHYGRDMALELLYSKSAEHLDINSFLLMNSSSLGLSHEEVLHLKDQTAHHYLREYMDLYNEHLESKHLILANRFSSLESYPVIISEFEKRFSVIEAIIERVGSKVMKTHYN